MFSLLLISRFAGFGSKLTNSMAAPAAPKVSAIRHWASRRWKRHHRDFGTPPEGGCGWYLELVPGTSQDTSPILANFPVDVTHASVRYMNIWNINPYNRYTYYLYTYYSKLSSLFSQDLHFRHPSLYTIVLYEIGHWWNAWPIRTKLDQPSGFRLVAWPSKFWTKKGIKEIFNSQQKGSNVHTYTNYV